MCIRDRRIGYLLLVAFFIASFYLQPLDLFWQGMHAPNMFLHRYSWLLSLLIVLLAGEILNRIKNFSFKRLLLSFLVLSTSYLLTWIFQSHYSFIESVSWLLSLSLIHIQMCIRDRLKLLESIGEEVQTFMTTTSLDHLSNLPPDLKTFLVKNGNIYEKQVD